MQSHAVFMFKTTLNSYFIEVISCVLLVFAFLWSKMWLRWSLFKQYFLIFMRCKPWLRLIPAWIHKLRNPFSTFVSSIKPRIRRSACVFFSFNLFVSGLLSLKDFRPELLQGQRRRSLTVTHSKPRGDDDGGRDWWSFSHVITPHLQPEPLMCSPPSTPHFLHSFAFSPRYGQWGSAVKLGRDGNKEDRYPRPTLTHTSQGLNYTSVSGGSVQMWRESHSSSDPRGQRAGWGGMQSPGTTKHYMHDECVGACACSLSNTHTGERHTRLSSDQSDIQLWWGAICRGERLGVCLAGEARKAMALFSCKKLKNLLLYSDGDEGGWKRRDGGWINKSAINHFLFAFVN